MAQQSRRSRNALVLQGAVVSQRNSEYARRKNDEYETPEWVVNVLLPHLPNRIIKVFDPCCGSGNIVRALQRHSQPSSFARPCVLDAWGKDLERNSYDFLQDRSTHGAIITNPPYNLAEKFIAHALSHANFVAMLLRTDYDHAKTRRHLFAECKWFSKIVRIHKRIVFIERTDGKRAAPSEYHSWFIWDHARERSAAIVAYAP